MECAERLYPAALVRPVERPRSFAWGQPQDVARAELDADGADRLAGAGQDA